MSDPVLSVRDLRVAFGTLRGAAHVVNGLDYDLAAGETLAIVGESGSGKSVSVLALTGLVPRPPARVSGTVLFAGQDLIAAKTAHLRSVRGTGIGMVFQDPMTSLNPVLRIGKQITEGMEYHLGTAPAEARAKAAALLERVGIPSAQRRLDDYPHQLSGGMRQRVMIAIGLACDPKVLIADEATTALDVTTQAQIVELVAELQRERGMAVIWITHDLGVVAGIADRVAVMYAGRIVEQAGVDALYDQPRHPYTQRLLAALPRLGGDAAHGPQLDLETIDGRPPDPAALPPGCAFWPRCHIRADDRCKTELPPLAERAPGHRVATFYDAADAS